MVAGVGLCDGFSVSSPSSSFGGSVRRLTYRGFSFIHFVFGLIWMMFFWCRVSAISCSWVWGMFSFVDRMLRLCHFWSFSWLRRSSSLESEVKWSSL